MKNQSRGKGVKRGVASDKGSELILIEGIDGEGVSLYVKQEI